MSPTPLSVDATATLTEAAAQMHARGVGAALVMNGEHLSGILTERDILRAVATGEVEGTRVGAWMTQDRKSTRLNSSHLGISYAVFCLKKKNKAGGRVGPQPP